MASSSDSSFEPLAQPITIYMADGVTPVVVSLSDIDNMNLYNTISAVISSCQLGACLVMFFVLTVLTKQSKRGTAMFLLNSSSLVFGFFEGLLIMLYYVSPWTYIYGEFTYDFAFVPRSAFASSVAAPVFSFLLTLTVNMSLVVQAYTVCRNLRGSYRYPIIGLACLAFLSAVGFRFAEMVTNCMAIMASTSYVSMIWIQIGSLATETSSIWFFSIIFTGKLVYTLITRKIMGWKQWSGVRILAAMGGCTMIIPSIFAALQYSSLGTVPQVGSLALPVVALLLPLSSLWAGMAIDHETATLNLSNLSGSDSTRGVSAVDNSFPGTHSNPFGHLTSLNSSGPDTSTLRKSSTTHHSPISIDSRIEHARSYARDSTELDLEAMGVRIDRSYEVRNEKE